MPSSPFRRVLVLGALLAAGAGALAVAQEREPAASAGGNVKRCATLTGDAARGCYSREVGRVLAAVNPGSGGAVTLAAQGQGNDLLCDLHTRMGVVDNSRPAWLGWNEPLS